MKVIATAKHVRVAPRKVRLVIDQVRGVQVVQAEHILRFMSKKGAEPVLKLLRSAVANAVHNFKLDKNNLYVKTITADKGLVMKRYMPRAFGRASQIQKKTSHIMIELGEKKAMAATTKKSAPLKKTAAIKKPLAKAAAKKETK